MQKFSSVVRVTLILTLLLVLGNSCETKNPYEVPFTIDLNSSRYSVLKVAGNVLSLNNVLILNRGNNIFVAVSEICPTDYCLIEYNHQQSNFRCNCCSSFFSLTGEVITGEAEEPLVRYSAVLKGTLLTVDNPD